MGPFPILLINIVGLSLYSLIIWILEGPVLRTIIVSSGVAEHWMLAAPCSLLQGHQRCSWKLAVLATWLAEMREGSGHW